MEKYKVGDKMVFYTVLACVAIMVFCWIKGKIYLQ